MESLAESNIVTWMTDKEEVQLVDMVLRIRAKLTEATSQNLPLPDIVRERLEKHVDTIVKTLPSDLHAVLQKGTILSVDKNCNGESCDDNVTDKVDNERTSTEAENTTSECDKSNDNENINKSLEQTEKVMSKKDLTTPN